MKSYLLITSKKLSSTVLFLAGLGTQVVMCQAPALSEHRNGPRLLDTNELAFLESGVGTNEILAKLGPPHQVLYSPSADSCWIYDTGLPNNHQSPVGSGFIGGIQIWVTNGQVKAWSYVVGGVESGPTVSALPPAFEQEPVVINLYVVSEASLPGTKQIVMEYPKSYGYVSSKPDLTISVINKLSINTDVHAESNQTAITNWTFSLTLTGADSNSLSTLTESNIGKRVLIKLGGEPFLPHLLAVR